MMVASQVKAGASGALSGSENSVRRAQGLRNLDNMCEVWLDCLFE